MRLNNNLRKCRMPQSRKRLISARSFWLDTRISNWFPEQDYGASIALDVTSRTLVVGSPLADYDKLGTDEPETYDTRPDKAEARAKGKIYVYYSKPAVQVRVRVPIERTTATNLRQSI